MTFYTYMWFREDATPYYVGKGSGRRAFKTVDHGALNRPKLGTACIRIYSMPDEETAFAYERYMIDFYGRVDLGTGCLRNLTDGGENPPKAFTSKEHPRSAAWCSAISRSKKGCKRPDAVQYLRNEFLTPQERSERGKCARSMVKRAVVLPALHSRWHVNRGIVKEGCALCH